MNWRNIIEEVGAWLILAAILAGAVVLWEWCGKREIPTQEWHEQNRVAAEAFFATNDCPVFVYTTKDGIWKTWVTFKQGYVIHGSMAKQANSEPYVISDGTNDWFMHSDGSCYRVDRMEWWQHGGKQ